MASHCENHCHSHRKCHRGSIKVPSIKVTDFPLLSDLTLRVATHSNRTRWSVTRNYLKRQLIARNRGTSVAPVKRGRTMQVKYSDFQKS